MDDTRLFVFTDILMKEDCEYSVVESNLPIIRPVPYDENPLKTEPEKVIETFKVNIDLAIHAYV